MMQARMSWILAASAVVATVCVPVSTQAVDAPVAQGAGLAPEPGSAPGATDGATPATAELAGVAVAYTKDPALLPYKRGYEFATRMRQAGGDRVRLKLRILSAQTKAPIENLEIRIAGSKDHGRVAVSADGSFEIPLDQEALDDDADFVTNQKKGTLEIQASLVPVLPADAVHYSDIQESIKAARRVRSEMLPWYLRVILPTVRALGVCYTAQGEQVLVRSDGTEQRRAADREETGAAGVPVHCAQFGESESGLRADAMVLPANGWEPVYIGSWF